MMLLQWDQSTNPKATELCVQLNKCFVVCFTVLQRGQYGEVGVFASTLCKYDLKKGNLFVLSWVRVRRVCGECFIIIVI